MAAQSDQTQLGASTAKASRGRANVPAAERAAWRSVAVPSEHGGWGLSLEPALLGLVVAPSSAGAALAVATMIAFLVRTPLKLVLVDRFRDRSLPRTRLAARIAGVELLALVVLAALAVRWAGPSWLVPVVIAAPLVAMELWFDMRSRGRRLAPELAGAVGIGAAAAAISLAGGSSASVAVGLWLVLAARAVASIPFVRTQVLRLHRGEISRRTSDLAQAGGVAVAVAAVAVDGQLLAGAIGVIALCGAQLVWSRRPPIPAKVLGLRQMALGLALVAVTATGVIAT